MSEGAAIIAESQEIDALALSRARRVARFEASREYEEQGYPNTVAFLKDRCNLSTADAIEVLNVAHQLDALPRVEAAMAQGCIGFGHAAVIAESAERFAEVVDRQEELLAKAEELDPSRLRQVVKRVEMQIDTARVKENGEALYRSRRLYLKRLGDGRFALDGVLDPEGGALLKTALNAAMGPRANDETRQEEQRRADALVDVARRALDGRQLSETGCQRPHVTAFLDLTRKEAELEQLGPVARETVERLLCDCSLSLNGSSERRTFSAPMRRSLMRANPKCHFPSCDRPADWCEGHHLDKWSQGGRTVVERGALLCGFHHRLVHEGGWDLVKDDDQLVAISPGGEKFRSAKAPPAA